ncbi:DMT family transporter [Gluconacetobacter entanii]|uniref:EamA family transporter n=1 Tax=Gluconacetobacter entanii TaxID=108528 RepID=A0A318PQN8_9PROT|nr:DMT family transporter [Gluconacetobacter entanii]MCE2578210.1 DMT family transporter [Komagataeibacter sp. FNDCR1]PYD62589.1 EamA family transporter [Gluconacetobacter entanii]
MNSSRARSHSSLLAGLGNGLAAGACWGLVFIAPAMMPDFTALQLATVRYLMYGFFSVALVLPRWRRLAACIPQGGRAALLGLGLTGNLGYYILIAMAVRLCGINITSIITGFLPVIVGILGTREGDSPGLRRLVPSMLLMVAGISLTALQALHAPGAGTDDPRVDMAHLLGFLCAIGGLASWSIFALANARWLRRLSDTSAGDWGLLTGVATGVEALFVIPFACHGAMSHPPSRWVAFIVLGAFIALVSSLLGGIFWNRTCRLLPMTLCGQMAVGETLFALFYGCLWTGRWPTAMEGAAVLFLVLSVVCSTLAHAPSSASSDTSHAPTG